MPRKSRTQHTPRTPGDEPPVVVTPDVLAGLEAARESGAHNMLDWAAVARWCATHEHYDAALWIADLPHQYLRGILAGYVASAHEPPPDTRGAPSPWPTD